MSEASDSSQNYHNIVTNLLNFKKQWQQVPEVVYLTIKALFNHGQQLEESIYRHRELITEQSVRLKEIGVEVEDLVKGGRAQMLYMETSKIRESGFRKSKKGAVDNSMELRSRSKKKNEDSSPETMRENRSLSFDKGLDKTMVEEVKALAEAIIDQKSKGLQMEIQNLKDEMSKKVNANESKLVDELHKQMEDRLRGLSDKLSQTEAQINKKLQTERSVFMTYAEDNSTQMEKLLIQINSINIRLSEMAEQSKTIYSNPVYLREQKNEVQKGKGSSESNDQRVQAQLMDKLTNLSKDFADFKMKTMREVASFMKTQAVESIVSRFQTDTNEKISKLNSNFNNVSKLVEGVRREGLAKNESKGMISAGKSFEQKDDSKRQKYSERSLAIIQQSLQKLESHFKQKLKSMKKQILSQMETAIQRQQIALKKDLREEMQIREKTLCDVVQSSCDKLNKNQDKEYSFGDNSLKKAVQNLSEQMVLARYLHLGERSSKDVIEWEKNVYNAMEENYVWKTNSHMVTVMAAGLYRVEAGLYTDNEADKVQAYIVVNGMPISSLKNKEVPVNSQAPSRGSLFNQALLLPARSKIWLKTQSQFYGQAYLQILRL